MKKLALSLAFAVLLAGGAVPASATHAVSQKPGAFIARVYQWTFDGRYDRLFATLAPQQRRILGRRGFEACEGASRRKLSFPDGIRVVSWRQLRAHDVRITVPGTHQKVVAVAATVRLSVTDSAGDRASRTQTFHLVPLRGGWRWILGYSRDDPCGARLRRSGG